ncbi:MAG: ATP synthase F1 subunit epsilon [Microcoleaceae cyanobacterium]
MTLNVRVIAPTRTIWDDTAEEVILPSTTGQLGILSGHAPLLTALATGVMRVRVDKQWVPIALMEGFAEIEADEVTVLVNDAEKGEAIDLEEARKVYQTAKTTLDQTSPTGSRQDQLNAEQAYKRARARLQAAGGSVD